MRRTPFLGVLILTGALCPLAPLASASAAPEDCTPAMTAGDGEVILIDATRAVWEVSADGEIRNGAILAPDDTVLRSDAFDRFPKFAIDDGTNGREVYDNPAETCTFEVGDRQVALPTMTTVGGLELSRKVYVPAGGSGFARFYNQVHNPGASAATISVYTSDGTAGNLGGESDTRIEGSSVGQDAAFVDRVLDRRVSWFTTSGDRDPVLTHGLDGAAASVEDTVDAVRQDTSRDQLTFEYQDVTVPAGGTVSYLSFETMRLNVPDAVASGDLFTDQAEELFTGLTAAEIAAVRNWNTVDADGDGVANATDNCRIVVNPGQGNVDRDGLGDACDSDRDGDGIADTLETAFGLDPAKADTDGDGVRDDRDSCPKVAGTSVDGCTVPIVVVNNVRAASATRVTGTMTQKGRVVVRVRGSVRSRSTAGTRDCTNGLVQVVVKVRRVAVADKIVRLRTTCRFHYKVRLTQPRATVKKVSVKARFLGSDGLRPSARRDKI